MTAKDKSERIRLAAENRRRRLAKRYVVFHLKEMEFLHLILLSLNLDNDGATPENVLGHSADRFRETLLGVLATSFAALDDNPRRSTNALAIWKELYPRNARAIGRVWERSITPGALIMKRYRDQAGAHGDEMHLYFDAKIELQRERDKVLSALNAFLNLSIRLLHKQAEHVPTLGEDIETVLFDYELTQFGSLNRQWLRELKLIESGRFTKRFY